MITANDGRAAIDLSRLPSRYPSLLITPQYRTEEVLTRRGYTALLANTDNDQAKERIRFEALRGRQVDGFIVATAQRLCA